MARFRTEGLDEIISDMEKMSETTGELAENIIMGCAEKVKQCWKKAATERKARLTDQMFNSIGYARKPKKVNEVLTIDIYPQGKSTYTEKNGKKITRKKPVRNAEVAFINHYGTSKHPGTHFVDLADDLSGPEVEAEAKRIYEEWLGKNGY